MAEINNSLALGVKPPEFDIIKPLMGAAQINSLRANTAQTEQETNYRQFQQDQGGGYRAGEANTLAATHEKQLNLAGQIGNAMVKAKTPQDRQQVIQMSHEAGRPVDPKTEATLMNMPLDQFHQHGEQMRQSGMGAATNTELNPEAIAQRNQASSGGALLGGFKGPPGYQNPAPKGGDGTPALDVSLLEQKQAAEGQAQLSTEQLKKYQANSETAANQKVAIRQIMLDADKVRTGQGAAKEQAARKWLQAASEYIPALKQYSPNQAIAAYESIEKNKGFVAREAMKSVGGTAASELSAISDAIVGGSTSNGGIKNNGSQLIGFKNMDMAKHQAAQAYFSQNQTTKGFDANFAKNAGPAAWVYMAAPDEEQKSIRETLNKTKQGQGILGSIAKQIHYIHKNKLDEGLD